MATVVFLQPDGSSREVDVHSSISVMNAARQAGIEGIVAECGGEMVCATCHIYMISPNADDALFPMSAVENEMLDFTAEARCDNSRLSCQIIVPSSDIKMVVEIPTSQI